MRFSHKVTAASSILLLVTASLLSLQQLSTVRTDITEIISHSLKELATGVADTVTTEMESKKTLAQFTTDVLQLDANNRHLVKQVLETPKLKNNFIVVGLGYKSDGSVIHNDDNWKPDSQYDSRKRPWYLEAQKYKKLTVTKPYLDTSIHQMIISIATPVMQKNHFIGAMFYDMNLSRLAEMVNKINLFNAGNMFIITADGMTVAHQNTKYNGQNITSYLPDIKIQQGTQNITLGNKEFMLDFTYMPKENWYVGTLIDRAKAFTIIYKLRQSAIIYTIVGILLSIVILTLLIRFLMRPLTTLNTAIKDVASGQGDLTKRLSTDTDAEFAELASGFNSFTETLQQRIRRSKNLGTEIKQGAEKTMVSMNSSSQAMLSQLQELEQLATAMNEMSVTASEVANNAQSAASGAKNADEATTEGSQVVADTTSSIDMLSSRIDLAVEEIHELKSATANIENILQVINEIADQTNLLALNAAIEAARAGDSGRGFAVVADEVRTLAQRTQKSTTEIRSMIEQLQAGANSVSSAMNESKVTAKTAVEKAQLADDALRKIDAAIKHISDMNIQIASAAEEQSLVAEEINNNTMNIKDLSTQVSESAQEANVAMQEQTEKVRDQDAILGKFIV